MFKKIDSFVTWYSLKKKSREKSHHDELNNKKTKHFYLLKSELILLLLVLYFSSLNVWIIKKNELNKKRRNIETFMMKSYFKTLNKKFSL